MKKKAKRFCGECFRCGDCGKTEAEHMKCPTQTPFTNPVWPWPYIWYSPSIWQSQGQQTGTIYTTPSVTVTGMTDGSTYCSNWPTGNALEVNQ